ncbi:MAG TPA: hypothetical protein VFQ87_05880 [Bradyrhizobium sp.]|jgi:hypothetical protein|nr:hypothetical protein [Bradyrhizobium sp.]
MFWPAFLVSSRECTAHWPVFDWRRDPALFFEYSSAGVNSGQRADSRIPAQANRLSFSGFIQ